MKKDTWYMVGISILFAAMIVLVLLHHMMEGENTAHIPSCSSDDGVGPLPCIWEADKSGNREGKSFFVDKNGNIYTIR